MPHRANRRSTVRRALRLATSLLALALLATACGRQPPRRVFLITVDTLRADHLGYHGYPRATSPYLDGLAAQSVVFDRAISQWPKTGPSFASLFTGQYPLTTGLTHKAAIEVPAAYLTLPELFQKQGYRTVAVNSNGVLSKELGWNSGFDEYIETRDAFAFEAGNQVSYRGSMNALKVNELALPLLARQRDASQLFAWIHYSDPHTPYLLPPGVSNPFVGDAFYDGAEQVSLEKPEATQIDDHLDLKFYVSQYDANVLVVDGAIAKLMGELERLGLLDGALVIFSADHGESLGEKGSYLEHGRYANNSTLHVPLFFYFPGEPQRARRISQPVELVDLYPTLRDLVAPTMQVAGLEGKSLQALVGRRAPATADLAPFVAAFSQAGGGTPLTHYRSVQTADWQLVFHPRRETRKGETLPESWELYDLKADPLGRRDLASERPEDKKRLSRLLVEWMQGRLWIYPPKGLADQHGDEMLKQLKALGYV